MPSKNNRTRKPKKCEYCDGTIEDRIARVPFHYKAVPFILITLPSEFARSAVKSTFLPRFTSGWAHSQNKRGVCGSRDESGVAAVMEWVLCRPIGGHRHRQREKRPSVPADAILTPEIGYSNTPVHIIPGSARDGKPRSFLLCFDSIPA